LRFFKHRERRGLKYYFGLFIQYTDNIDKNTNKAIYSIKKEKYEQIFLNILKK